MSINTNQIETKFSDLDGFIYIKSGGNTLKIRDIPNSRRVEAHFQGRKQIVFEGEKGGIISDTEFWQMFTRSGVLKH